MGNSGSHHSGNHSSTPTSSSQRPSPTLHLDADIDDWTQSFPRSPYHHKLVVPDRDAHQRLRPTGNGEILHAGGTISGRNQQWPAINRSSSIPAIRQQRVTPAPSSIPQQPQFRQYSQQPGAAKSRIPMYRHQQSRLLAASARKEQMKRCGSEPDLRAPGPVRREEDMDRYKGRKKYRAPQPPVNPSLLPIDHRRNELDGPTNMAIASPIRRARLFKTRAETKKKHSSPSQNRKHLITEMPGLLKQEKYKSTEALFSRGEESFLPLNKAATRGVHPIPPQMQRIHSSPEFQAELKQVTRRLVNRRRDTEEQINRKLKTLDHNNVKKESTRPARRSQLTSSEDRTGASGKEIEPKVPLQKVKTFYFGMETDVPASLAPQRIPNSIGSDATSESETENSAQDISLQLRPILPKKQLEVPRFSPAAAWKLLSAVDTQVAESTLASEEGSVFIEDRIEKNPRIPPPYRDLLLGSRSNHDKSGDSGISGDETPEGVLPSPKPRGLSWTPQQDLGDDSSLEEGSHSELNNIMKYPSRPHVFSLSLPRDNQLASYITDKNFLQPYSSLQKIKRSMSGVLGSFAKKEVDAESADGGENWFLSRSAPNSLNNGFNSLEFRRTYKVDEPDGPKQTRRIMYLPQSNADCVKTKHQPRPISKSFENLAIIETVRKPQDLQDPPRDDPVISATKWTKKPKKFTFQSTVRQIERKRLADKLSKEAERKEQQRLRELEAMQKVEEEFQKKRAREKASIRQQLRMYSMDDNLCSSLPPNLDEVRAEPDGAVSSSSASSPTFKKSSEKETAATKPPVTQILSEYRQPQRDYKEFRTSFEHHQPLQHPPTVHPRVSYHMPKATG